MLMLVGMTYAQVANAGVINPDCTAQKAVKNAAVKATVGVSGRCDPAEAVKDTAGKAVENALPQDGATAKLVDKATGKDETVKEKAVDAVVPDKLQKDKDDKKLIKKATNKIIE
ncbi:hypothetical protein OHT75_00015 [Shewanella sp. FYR11-62]|uniref:Uncharacterized protein n=2 Tax=Shewanella subflava TaxID=2986476 RepID=A0ABT3I4A5_9GAMM|nr:hypothetical protein [Shewanella subflava]